VESLKIINLKYKVPYSKYISQSKAWQTEWSKLKIEHHEWMTK
jgi:hypothetical protein